MSDLPSATDPESSPSNDLVKLIGDRWDYRRIAAALHCTERSVYTLVDRHRIPYIRVLNTRYVDPDQVREALLREQANIPPRGRGRPRKAA